MKTPDQLAQHDLSLMFDKSGRLWRFRPTHSAHGRQPVDAAIVDSMLVVTVTVPGLKAGDVDFRAKGDVLEIRGKTDDTMGLAADIGLPMSFGLDQLETAYAGEALSIKVLPPSRARTTITETVKVAC